MSPKETAETKTAEAAVPKDFKAEQLQAASKFAKENVMPYADEIDTEKKAETQTTPAFKLGDVELDESEVKTVLKVFKKDKFEDVSSDWENNLNWKKRNAEEGQKLNVSKAEAEQMRKDAESLKEELANRQKTIREDLLKETEINNTYDAKVKQIKDEIKEKKKSFDLDDESQTEAYEELRFDLQSKIAVLELKRENELNAHKSYMQKIETEEQEKQERLARENLYNLTLTFPDKFNADNILNQNIQFHNLTLEQKKDLKVLDNFPDYKEYIVLRDFAIKNGIVNLSSAQELRFLREMVKTYIGERTDWEKKIAELKKSGYDEAVKEIKSKGISFFETADITKKITVEDLAADSTKIKQAQLAAAGKILDSKFANRIS